MQEHRFIITATDEFHSQIIHFSQTNALHWPMMDEPGASYRIINLIKSNVVISVHRKFKFKEFFFSPHSVIRNHMLTPSINEFKFGEWKFNMIYAWIPRNFSVHFIYLYLAWIPLELPSFRWYTFDRNIWYQVLVFVMECLMNAHLSQFDFQRCTWNIFHETRIIDRSLWKCHTWNNQRRHK